MARDPDDAPSDYAYLEGRLLRLESENTRLAREQTAIRRIHDHLSEQVEGLTQELRRFREDRGGDPWRENTEVRNQRRVEMESLRARARDADEAESLLAREKALFYRRLGILVPSLAALLYGLVELVKGLVHH